MKIRSICADLFRFGASLDYEHPVAILVEFSDVSAIRISVSGDGESIVFDRQHLRGAVDMAEFGNIETHQLTNRFQSELLSSEITAMNEIVDGNDIAVGLAFISDEKPGLCIWNYGDELYYGSFAAMTEQDWETALRVSEIGYELG